MIRWTTRFPTENGDYLYYTLEDGVTIMRFKDGCYRLDNAYGQFFECWWGLDNDGQHIPCWRSVAKFQSPVFRGKEVS